jgi:hypothetical protein
MYKVNLDYNSIIFCVKCKCIIKYCSYNRHLKSQKHNLKKNKPKINNNNNYLITFD